MKKIALRNKKRESLWFGIISLALSAAIFYIAYTTTTGGYVYGKVFMELEKDSFQMLTFIISLIPLAYSLIKFMDYRSLIKLGDRFEIRMGLSGIHFPIATRFKGFQMYYVEKHEILFARAYNRGKSGYEVRLMNDDFQLIVAIDYHELFHSKQMSEEDLAHEINVWLDNWDRVDPTLF